MEIVKEVAALFAALISDSFLDEKWNVFLINAWCNTGRLVAKTCIGLLIVSPVLDKLRTFLIDPRKEEIRQAQEKLEASWSSFAESRDSEKIQYQLCKAKYETIKAALEADSVQIVSNGYYNCLSWALVIVALMCVGLDYILGPLVIFAAHPLYHLHSKLKKRAQLAITDMKVNQQVVDTFVKAWEMVDKERAQVEADRILREAASPSPPQAKKSKGRNK